MLYKQKFTSLRAICLLLQLNRKAKRAKWPHDIQLLSVQNNKIYNSELAKSERSETRPIVRNHAVSNCPEPKTGETEFRCGNLKKLFSPFTSSFSSAFGFSLAEVLITLGIIGVLAAMTIPNLIANSQKEQYTTAFLKNYSEIGQAWQQIISDNGGQVGGSSDIATYSAVVNTLATKLSIVRPAVLVWNSNYLPPDYKITSLSGIKDFGGSSCYFTGCGYGGGYMYLKNGSILFLSAADSSTSCDMFKNNGTPDTWGGNAFKVGEGGCYIVTIDTNGLKAPNTLGRDIFYFWLTSHGLNFMSYGTAPANYSTGPLSRCNSTDVSGEEIHDADLCAYRLFTEGKMNY